MPDQTVTSSLRAQLESERSQLRGQLEQLNGGDEGSGFDDNFADSGQVAAELGEVQSLARQLRDQLHEVEHALAKMDKGTYGQCEVCGGEIAPARLEAMPAARHCINHA